MCVEWWMLLQEPSDELVLVTAASHHFFGALQNLVGSVHFWEPALRIVVYDIGLTAQDRAAVRYAAS